jgi:tetratricopeptide (TPR) repeat protein
MRLLVVGSLLCAAIAGAAPSSPLQPAKRKPPPDGFPAEAIEPFVDAVLADKAGNLSVALRRYQDANKVSEQASTHYNIADVLRRMERWKQAIESYRKYLELAPNAPDRAEVERLIATIEARPGTAVIDGEDPGAVVFVDGKLMGPSPVVLQLADGRHVADRITPTGWWYRSFEMKPATHEHIRLTSQREEPGNVVLNGNLRFGGSWHDNGNEYRLPGRVALPPGRHTTYLVSPNRACSPLVFDAPKPDEVVYVWVEASEAAGRAGGCLPIKVQQTKVRFPP